MSAAWPSGKERCNCDRYGLGLKPTCAILLCLEKETLSTFPYLAVFARSSKFLSYLCKKTNKRIQPGRNILAAPETNRGNCLTYI